MTDTFSTNSQPDPPQTVPSTSSPALVERNTSLSVIKERLQETRDGRGGGLALRGISGSGKTTLLRQTMEIASAEGMTAVFIDCRGTLHRPYQPVADLVRNLLGISSEKRSDEQRQMLAQALEYLGIPELGATFRELLNLISSSKSNQTRQTMTGTLVSHSRGIELPDALTRLLEGFQRRGHSACLLFDDLDQAHQASQTILSNLLQALVSQPVLLLASFIPEVPGAFQLSFGSSLLSIENFSEDETREYTKILAKPSLDDEAFSKLWHQTEGYPLYTRMLIEDSALSALPTLPHLITTRLKGLSPELQKILEYAAILGDGFRIGALGTLLDQRFDDSVYAHLSELVESGWLTRSSKDRRALYRFANRVVLTTIYDQLSTDTRDSIHRRAGDYYAIPNIGRRLRSENAAYHYLKTKDPSRALSVIEMAILHAKQADDNIQLKTLYRQGAEVAAMSLDLRDRQIEMALELGNLYATEEDYHHAAKAYSELAPSTAPVDLLARLGLVLLVEDPTRSAKRLMEIAGAIPRDHPHDLFWRVEAGIVWALAESDHLYDAIRRSRDTLGMLGETAGLGDMRTLVRATLGMAIFYHDDPVEAHAHLESARAGWGARGNQEGILLINQVLIELPRKDIIRLWLKMVIRPLIT